MKVFWSKISNWAVVKSRLRGKLENVTPLLLTEAATDVFVVWTGAMVSVYPATSDPVPQFTDCAVRRCACGAGNPDAVAVAIVTLTGLLALRTIEPPAPFDAAGRVSVNVPLCAPGDAVGVGEGLDGVPGVGTDLDGVHAETMPLSATNAAKRKWDLRFTVCPRRRRKTAQHQVPRLAVPFYALRTPLSS